MKKRRIPILLILSIFLISCSTEASTSSESESGQETETTSQRITDLDSESEIDGNEETANSNTISFSGYAGTINVQIPDGWTSISLPSQEENGSYSIQFYPDQVEDGFVTLAYMDTFGVCGTGLESENIALSGDQATVGTYDGHTYWDYISYSGKNQGLVAQTNNVESWWEEYAEEVMDILDTAFLETEEAAKNTKDPFYYTSIDELGLSLNIDSIRPTGADLYFLQYDGSPKGSLQYGDYFIVEKKENGNWIEAPLVAEGGAAFTDVAYQITNDGTTSFITDWEWLYGALAPGEYRAGKEVLDFTETGVFDTYRIYVYFTVN
ncbi:MAG: immunoglobulin-like domain-containing protein [Lachnospiraceae bacterium]